MTVMSRAGPILFAFFFVLSTVAYAGGVEKNILTFDNKSGEKALVKLVGPSRRVVLVPNGEDKSVEIASGTYRIYVRYGEKGHYHYARGDEFVIEEVEGGYVKGSLTLHGVINGNYETFPSSKKEFESY